MPANASSQDRGPANGKSNSVERALNALEIVMRQGTNVTELARELGVDKSTASRLLASLAARRYVTRSLASGEYQLGPTIARLYRAYTRTSRIGREAAPLLDALARITGETVILTSYENGVATYVDRLESNHPLRASSRVGAPAPLHCGAAGKSILAHLSDNAARLALGSGPLKAYTARTITSRRRLSAELQHIREDGFAVSIEEVDYGVVGVGVPLIMEGEEPVGAISIVGPLVRMDEHRRSEIARQLMRAGKAWRDGRLPQNWNRNEA